MGRVALIFGISGQAGGYLAHLLLSKGYQVVGTSRDSQVNTFKNLVRFGIKDQIHLLSASLSDFRSVLRILQDVSPDEVYNLSGQSSVALSYEQPVETFESISLATLNILECLRIIGRPIRFFNAASTDCFGYTSVRANEESAFQPRSPYAMAKAASYWSVVSYRDAYGMHVSNGILSNHESPLRPNHFVAKKIILAAMRISRGNRERLSVGNLNICRDWGWAPDYADAMYSIVSQDSPSDFIVATGQTSSLKDLAELAFAHFGLAFEDYVEVDERLFRPSDIPIVYVDPTKIEKLAGWRAGIRMPVLVETIIAAIKNRQLGPVPWSRAEIPDLLPHPTEGPFDH